MEKQKPSQELTQENRILRHFEKYGVLDRKTAYESLGIFELSARICDLKRKGYQFETQTKTGTSRSGYSYNNTEYRLKTYLKSKEEQ